MKKARLLTLFALVLVAGSVGELSGAHRAYAATPTFTDIGAPLTGVFDSSVAWGDYNSDGRLDILFTGDTGSGCLSKIYKNNGNGTFSEDTVADQNLISVCSSAAAWGDYNSDGKLDILLTGCRNSSMPCTAPVAKLYRNAGGSFSEDSIAESGLVAVDYSSVAWGDYNSDGKPDILLTGKTGLNWISKIYKNNGNGTFSEDTTADKGLAKAYYGSPSVAWGDYNSDGKLDILLTGVTGSDFFSKIYENNGDGTFSEDTKADGGLTGVYMSSVAWGDYNSDGKPDILIAGMNRSMVPVTKIYKNNGNSSFSEDTTADGGLTGVYYSSVAWGDYNSDGKPDILLTGVTGSDLLSKIYTNNGNSSFSEDTTADGGLTVVELGSVAWGDYNSDGKLDILLTGNHSSVPVTKIYKNNTAVANTAPSAPANLAASFSSGIEILSWNAASDSKTPAAALTYNLRVGTTPGGSQIVSPLSLANGSRLLPQAGNVGERTTYALAGLIPGATYYWSVQAVDSGFAGSAFASEGTFTASAPALPTQSPLASASKPTPSSGKISAHLTRTSFARSKAGAVKLLYSFSPKSKVFAYVLSIKKGSKWTTVRSVRKTGSFKGAYTMTVKQLFGGKAIKAGRYRLKLSADANKKVIAFRVT